MKKSAFSGEDHISVLNFLTCSCMACNTNAVHEGAAMWCFQFYLTWQAHSLLQPRLRRESAIVNDPGTEALMTYPEVASFPFSRYATDEVIADADAELNSYRQRTGMTETEFSQKLRDKALRCENVYSEQRVKSLFEEGLLQTTRTRVRNYLTTHPPTSHTELARFSESCGDTHSSAKSSYAPLLDKSGASKSRQSDALTLDTTTSGDMDELTLEEEQDNFALPLASPQGVPTRSRMQSSPTSYTSTSSYKNVRFTGPRGYPPPCRISLLREPVQCTSLTPAMRATIPHEREKNFQEANATYSENSSYRTAYNDLRSVERRYGYRTPSVTHLQPGADPHRPVQVAKPAAPLVSSPQVDATLLPALPQQPEAPGSPNLSHQ